MSKVAVFLRGVNVGGKNKLPMAPFRAALEDAGLTDVRTYIQSGNLVCDAHDTVGEITKTVLRETFDIDVPVMVKDVAALRDIVDHCPFDTDVDPKTLHFMILGAPAREANTDKIEAIRAQDEQVHIGAAAAYLYAPSGIGRSKLAAQLEKHLGVSGTMRNLRSLRAIIDLQ